MDAETYFLSEAKKRLTANGVGEETISKLTSIKFNFAKLAEGQTGLLDEGVKDLCSVIESMEKSMKRNGESLVPLHDNIIGDLRIFGGPMRTWDSGNVVQMTNVYVIYIRHHLCDEYSMVWDSQYKDIHEFMKHVGQECERGNFILNIKKEKLN